jgi:hypothetical protein
VAKVCDVLDGGAIARKILIRVRKTVAVIPANEIDQVAGRGTTI